MFASTDTPADTNAFLDLVRARTDYFGSGDIYISRAPGRLDLMGGIADYSGSLVLELPIAHATHVALQRDLDEHTLRIESLRDRHTDPARTFELPVSELIRYAEDADYSTARAGFSSDDRWAAYVAGAFVVLIRESALLLSGGVRLLINSEVPEGKGVSSSAALEVAVMRAIAAAYNVQLSGPELAFLCQKVENLIAGAPCGVMDQMTASCGEADRLLALLCQPGELQGNLQLPDELGVWGIDSGIRHSVGGADYGTVRTAAFMGYRMIADFAGLSWRPTELTGKVVIDDPRWHGYLANVTVAEFRQSFASQLPEAMLGGEFLQKYSGITDPVTRVIADRSYPVLEATRHPVEEHHRVRAFAGILEHWATEPNPKLLGELMFESHASYSACGLGSSGTDALVEAVRTRGTTQGLFGAKITGGGSGGTVAVLGRRDSAGLVSEIAAEYGEKTGRSPMIIAGSSPGAMNSAVLRITL